MYIFLDESFNLKDRTKLQLISINGFKTTAVKRLWKQWRIYRKGFVKKARIHATDQWFEPLREKSVELLESIPDTTVLSVMQMIKDIPPKPEHLYYKKDKLDFEKVYEDMLKALFDRLQFQEYKKVIISIDSRKTKTGRMSKYNFQLGILEYLNQYYPTTQFEFKMTPSSSNILIEVADFISNNFYKHYSGQKIDLLNRLKGKAIIIKNPLGKPRG